MISGGITLTAMIDAEFTRLHLSTDTIVVDPYNVQQEPLVITMEKVSGMDLLEDEAYITVQALSLSMPISGALKEFGLVKRAEYTIPATDMKYATATAVKVEAYVYDKDGKKKVVDHRTVNVTCNQEPKAYDRGESWTANMTFRNGDYLVHEVNGNNSIYMWSCRVNGNTSKAPWNITLTTDPEYGYWEHVTEKTLFASKMLLAKGALIGASVFDGNYAFSQHGVDENGRESTEYNLFGKKTTDGRDEFTPNIMIDWLTGRMNGKDVDIEGSIKAKEGWIGSVSRDAKGNLSGNGLILEYDGIRSVNFSNADGVGTYYSTRGMAVYASGTGILASSTGILQAARIVADSNNAGVYGLEIIAKGNGYLSEVKALIISAQNRYGNPKEEPIAIEVENGLTRLRGKLEVLNDALFYGSVRMRPVLAGSTKQHKASDYPSGTLLLDTGQNSEGWYMIRVN